MSSLPLQLQRVGVPPLKCQGIKTKLVPFILSQICWQEGTSSRWIEPFVGSGVVAFNLAPKRALLMDTNQHIIHFYQAIQEGKINRAIVQSFLQSEGRKLNCFGANYYYEVRQRFNQTSNPLDFLFLNRSCFNGLMRFNRDGLFNVPFCQKPDRFSQAYITKIGNQVDWVARQMGTNQWEFRVSDWTSCVSELSSEDFVYLDPPYIGRHADYYNQWTQADAERLAAIAPQLPCGFALSMWLENQYRQNVHLQQCWQGMVLQHYRHFYHLGAKEIWRSMMTEALLIKPGYAAYPSQKSTLYPTSDVIGMKDA